MPISGRSSPTDCTRWRQIAIVNSNAQISCDDKWPCAAVVVRGTAPERTIYDAGGENILAGPGENNAGCFRIAVAEVRYNDAH